MIVASWSLPPSLTGTLAMDSVAALLQLAAAAIVAIAALVQTLDPAVVPSADHVVPCASGAAAWTPDVAVLAEACLLLAFGVHARCTRGRATRPRRRGA